MKWKFKINSFSLYFIMHQNIFGVFKDNNNSKNILSPLGNIYVFHISQSNIIVCLLLLYHINSNWIRNMNIKIPPIYQCSQWWIFPFLSQCRNLVKKKLCCNATELYFFFFPFVQKGFYSKNSFSNEERKNIIVISHISDPED